MSTCKECKFFSNIDRRENGNGACVKNPPTLQFLVIPTQSVAMGGKTILTIQDVCGWPEVHPENWCGAFEAIPVILMRN